MPGDTLRTGMPCGAPAGIDTSLGTGRALLAGQAAGRYVRKTSILPT